MKLVGRNFYDPTSAMVLQQHRLVVISSSSVLNVLQRKFSLQSLYQFFMIAGTICELIKCFIKFIVMLTSFVSCCFLIVIGEGQYLPKVLPQIGGMEISVVLLASQGKGHLCLQIADLAGLCS